MAMHPVLMSLKDVTVLDGLIEKDRMSDPSDKGPPILSIEELEVLNGLLGQWRYKDRVSRGEA